ERLAERRARQRVGILAAYAKFGLASAGTGRHLLRILIGNLGSPPAMPLVQLLLRNRLCHQLAQLGERVRPGTVYQPARSFDGRIGLRPADLATSRQSQVLELRRGQTSLDLEVAGPWPAQPLLPAPAAGGSAPKKQLPAAQ